MTAPQGGRRARLVAALSGSALSALAAGGAAGAASSRRNPLQIAGLFLLPIVVVAVIGVAMQGYSDPVFSVGFLDRSGGAVARALRAGLEAAPSVRVRDYDDSEAMRAAVYRGRLHAGVLIPAGWNGEGDLELMASAAGVGAVVVRAISDAGLAAALEPGLARTVPSRVYDGGHEGSPPIGFHYTAPANLVLFLVVGGMISSTGMLTMRRRGITLRLLATPARTGDLLLLMLAGPAQVMAAQALFLVTSTALGFGVPWGSPLGVFLLTASLIAVCLALGLLMATVFRSPEQAFSLAPLLSIVVGMLGGCMWPLTVVPAWLREAGHLLPTAWAMDGYLALIFERAEVAAVLPQAGVLLAMALGIGALGALRLRTRMSG